MIILGIFTLLTVNITLWNTERIDPLKMYKRAS